ncbi:endonuclease/exonuclease/phosphatase family protein [Actinocatenispora rupis]|uniref:Endonuclease n=1 Tax=Actinocatenispora rupis TaxID=519421 RepID=A0A8J3JAL0_9ACTN|nr:endonuclease/exonuclease/phosphatase family protein [Actinocatenispora rupis]GID11268.1 endonuclease [Actinocatenispora rupis]
MRVVRGVLWVLVLVVLAWAAVRVTGVLPPWPGLVVLALTPWAVLFGALVAVLALLARATWGGLVAAVAVVALAAVVVPRVWGAGEERTGRTVRVMTVNLRVGGADPAAVVRLVRDERIDVLAVQEYTGPAAERLTRAGLGRLLRHHVADPEPYAAGSALWSRFPLRDAATPTGEGGFTQASATVDLPGGRTLAVRSVHPCSPYTREHQGCWARGIAAEPVATTRGTPRVLLGDFNATLDHPPLRHLLGTGYRDAADVTGSGLRFTWPADRFPVTTLDHVLADRRIAIHSYAVRQVPGTDHRAVVAALTVP